MGLESFAETAALIAPGYHISSIEDVRFLAPLKYYRHEPRIAVVKVLLLRAPDGSIRAACSLSASQIIAGKTAQEKTHFLATVVLEHGAERPAKKHEAAPPNGGKTKKTAGKGKAPAHGADKGSIDHDGIYRVYFHGPAYQVLSKVALSADGSVQGSMSADLPSDLSKADRTWIHAPRLVELCFQTAGVYEIGLTGQMGLPAAISKVVVWETPPASRAIVAEVRPKRTEAGLVFDAAVKDESGRVYVELSGYTTSAIPGTLPEGDLAPFKPVGQVVG
jgi:hypothetical protein